MCVYSVKGKSKWGPVCRESSPKWSWGAIEAGGLMHVSAWRASEL